MNIVIIGTLDTKGNEIKYLMDQIRKSGHDTITIDAGVLGQPAFEPDVSRQAVAKVGGADLQDVISKAGPDTRGNAIRVMTKGTEKIVKKMFLEGKVDGIVALGGGHGTLIGASAMRALPIGVPKLIVSTVASGDVSRYVGTKDITMMYSVTDIAGLNLLTKIVLNNAAGAITGMVEEGMARAWASSGSFIGATMLGTTTPGVTKAKSILEERKNDVLIFHATGVGGRAFEEFIEAGKIKGVLDLTPHEIVDALFGGKCVAGPERLETAGRKGIPQVVSTGGLDCIIFAPDNVPIEYRTRRIYEANMVTVVRTSIAESEKVGEVMAGKLNKATGPTTVIIPLRGWSAHDQEGGILYDPEVNMAFIRTLKKKLKSEVKVIELEAHINDLSFAKTAVDTLEDMMGGR